MINSTLGKMLDNVPRLLGIVSYEILNAPTLVTGVVKTIIGAITIILPAVTTRLGRLDRITRRWARDKNGYNTGFSAQLELRSVIFLLCCSYYY